MQPKKIIKFTEEQKAALDQHRVKTGIPTTALIDLALAAYMEKSGIPYPAKPRKAGGKPSHKPKVTANA